MPRRPQQRLAIETEFAEDSERIARMYRDLLDALLAAERESLDVGAPARLRRREGGARGGTDHACAWSCSDARRRSPPRGSSARPTMPTPRRSSRRPAPPSTRPTQNLETEIALLKRLGKDATDLKVALIVARGTLTAAIFEPGVIQGLFRLRQRQVHGHARHAAGRTGCSRALLIVLILAGFGLLARLTRSLVRRAVASRRLSSS